MCSYFYAKINKKKYENVYSSYILWLEYCRSYSAINEFIKYFKLESKIKERIILSVSLYNPNDHNVFDVFLNILKFYQALKNSKTF